MTLAEGKEQIDIYMKSIMHFLETKKSNIRAKQYMATYECIVKISDENDEAEALYVIYQEKLKQYIEKHISRQIQSRAGDSREFLNEYVKQWKNYTIFTLSIIKMFNYLDRYYLKNGAEHPCTNLTHTALRYNREKVFDKKIGELRRSILTEIRKDRQSELVDRDLIKDAILQFIYMGYE